MKKGRSWRMPWSDPFRISDMRDLGSTPYGYAEEEGAVDAALAKLELQRDHWWPPFLSLVKFVGMKLTPGFPERNRFIQRSRR